MIHTEARAVEHFLRQPDESWIFREYRGIGSSVLIPSLQCTLPVADIYAGVLDLQI